MNTSPVSVHFDGGVANVRLRRPAVINALDEQMIEELIRVGEELISTATARAVIPMFRPEQNAEPSAESKRMLNMPPSASLAEQLLAESLEQDKILGTTNQLEAVRAKLARRPPIFT